MSSVLSYVIARLKEASTWAAIAALLAGIHVTLPAGLFDQITAVGMALAGLAGFLIPSLPSSTSTES